MILSTTPSPTMVYIVVACIGADTGSLLSVYNRCGHRPIYCKPVHDKQFLNTCKIKIFFHQNSIFKCKNSAVDIVTAFEILHLNANSLLS